MMVLVLSATWFRQNKNKQTKKAENKQKKQFKFSSTVICLKINFA